MFQSIVKYIFFEYFFSNRGVLRRDQLTKIKKNPKFDVIEKLAKVLKYFYFLLTFYPIFSPLLFAEAYFFYILFFFCDISKLQSFFQPTVQHCAKCRKSCQRASERLSTTYLEHIQYIESSPKSTKSRLCSSFC